MQSPACFHGIFFAVIYYSFIANIVTPASTGLATAVCDTRAARSGLRSRRPAVVSATVAGGGKSVHMCSHRAAAARNGAGTLFRRLLPACFGCPVVR